MAEAELSPSTAFGANGEAADGFAAHLDADRDSMEQQNVAKDDELAEFGADDMHDGLASPLSMGDDDAGNGGGVFKSAAYTVLRQERRLMSTGEITKLALQRGLIKCAGKTPEATMASALYTDVKRQASSIFVRPHAGAFGLRAWGSGNVPPEYEEGVPNFGAPFDAAAAAAAAGMAPQMEEPSEDDGEADNDRTPPASLGGASAPAMAQPRASAPTPPPPWPTTKRQRTGTPKPKKTAPAPPPAPPPAAPVPPPPPSRSRVPLPPGAPPPPKAPARKGAAKAVAIANVKPKKAAADKANGAAHTTPPPPARAPAKSAGTKRRKAAGAYALPSPDLNEESLFADFANNEGADAMDIGLLPLDTFGLDLERAVAPQATLRNAAAAAPNKRQRVPKAAKRAAAAPNENYWPVSHDNMMHAHPTAMRLPDPRVLRMHIDTMTRAYGPEHPHVGKAWLLLARLHHIRGENHEASQSIRNSMGIFRALAPSTITVEASAGCEGAYGALLHNTAVAASAGNGSAAAGHEDDGMANPIIRGALVREVRAAAQHPGTSLRVGHDDLVVVGHGIPTSGAPTPDAGPGRSGDGLFGDFFGMDRQRGFGDMAVDGDGGLVGSAVVLSGDVALPSPLPSPSMLGTPVKT